VNALLGALLQTSITRGAEAIDPGAGSAVFSALQAVAALLLVLAVAWYARRFLLGGGLSSKRGERMKIEERLGLDLRNALLIVRVDERRLLLATSDRGPARLVAELTPAALPLDERERSPESAPS
jgi:flagellar biogenesis protein FliO